MSPVESVTHVSGLDPLIQVLPAGSQDGLGSKQNIGADKENNGSGGMRSFRLKRDSLSRTGPT